jgi:hypothetical protein
MQHVHMVRRISEKLSQLAAHYATQIAQQARQYCSCAILHALLPRATMRVSESCPCNLLQVELESNAKFPMVTAIASMCLISR